MRIVQPKRLPALPPRHAQRHPLQRIGLIKPNPIGATQRKECLTCVVVRRILDHEHQAIVRIAAASVSADSVKCQRILRCRARP